MTPEGGGMVAGVNILPLVFIVAGFWHQELPESLLVVEGGRARDVRIQEGAIALQPGEGWLRTRRPYSDFILSFQYRLADPQGDAGVAVRTWPVRDGWPRVGYAIPLAGAPEVQLRARKAGMEVIEPGSAIAPADGEWHGVTVTCAGDRVTVGLDRQHAGTYKIAELSGAILFYARRRTLELRNITLRELQTGERIPRLSESPSLKEPRVLREVRPHYPRAVMRRRVQGAVSLEALILEGGAVGAIKVVESLDPVLDMEAAYALSRWRFRPATREGKPVPVVVDVELTFKLR
jgi:TonB family protein